MAYGEKLAAGEHAPGRARPAGPHGLDVQRLFDAIDTRRRSEELSWRDVTHQMSQLTADFHARRGGEPHPIAVSTITGMPQRGNTTCQHALVMLRWLDRAPEEFIAQPRPGTSGVPLPAADPAHTLRWDLKALHSALDERRNDHGATWKDTAQRLYCTPKQLTGLRHAKYATNMRLAMRICQGLRRPTSSTPPTGSPAPGHQPCGHDAPRPVRSRLPRA